MRESKSSLSSSIEEFYKSRSKRLHSLHQVSCHVWEQTKKTKPTAEDSLALSKSNKKKDDRAEIQFVIDSIRNDYDKGSCKPLELLERNMNSIVMVVRENDLELDHVTAEGEEMYRLRSRKLQERNFFINNTHHVICPDSKYAEQQSASSLGTGFFIKPEIIATAAHVVYPPFPNLAANASSNAGEPAHDINEFRFITNIKVTTAHARDDKILVPSDDIYKPVKQDALLASNWASLGADWALVKVEKANGKPIGKEDKNTRTVVGYQSKVKEGDDVYCLGHGFGLPLKIALKGTVAVAPGCGEHFDCDLDVFSGNSGSPVFNADNHRVVGILIRGERNFIHGPHEEHEGKHCLLPSTASGIGDREECQIMKPIIDILEELQNATPSNTASVAKNISIETEPPKHIPYTYLTQGKKKGQVDLFIAVPSVKGKKVNFLHIPVDLPKKKNANIRNMIRFIDCEYIATESDVDTDFEFQRYTLSRTFFDKEETIEVRVRIPDGDDNQVRFNRTIVFFDDAKEPKKEAISFPASSSEDQNLAYNSAYTFIERREPEPADSADDNEAADPVFWVHVLVPTEGKEIHLKTLAATKGENNWAVNLPAKKSRGIRGGDISPSLSPTPDPFSEIDLHLNIRERLARVDKPETPPLGSTGG